MSAVGRGRRLNENKRVWETDGGGNGVRHGGGMKHRRGAPGPALGQPWILKDLPVSPDRGLTSECHADNVARLADGLVVQHAEGRIFPHPGLPGHPIQPSRRSIPSCLAVLTL